MIFTRKVALLILVKFIKNLDAVASGTECDEGWILDAGQCISVFCGIPRSWNVASNECMAKASHLAIVRNNITNQLVSKSICFTPKFSNFGIFEKKMV